MVRYLSEQKKIEILMMIGYGDRIRSQDEVVNMFNAKYPEDPITQSCVSKVLRKFEENGHVRDRPRSGRPAINNDERLDILLEAEENCHSSTRQIATNNNISQFSVWKTLKKAKYNPYKITLVHELNEDDADRRLQFCEQMTNMLSNDEHLLSNIIFSDEATFFLMEQ